MQEFKDKTGGVWQIDLTVGAAMRVHSQSEGTLDLFDPNKDDLGQRLIDSLPRFWEVLWLLVEPQARTRNVNAEQFGELMAADCLIDAQRKFLGEWRDFFSSLQSPHKARVVELLDRTHAKALEMVREKLATPEVKGLDERIDRAMAQKSEQWFGNLRESLDLTLGPLPSAS